MLIALVPITAEAACDPGGVLVEGTLVRGRYCIMDEPLEAACERLFGLTEEGCCPTFQRFMEEVVMGDGSATEGIRRGDLVRCSDENPVDDSEYYAYGWWGPDPLFYNAVFETDGTLVSLEEIVEPGPGGYEYEAYCCGDEGWAPMIRWGETPELDCAAMYWGEVQHLEDTDLTCDLDQGDTDWTLGEPDRSRCGCGPPGLAPMGTWLVAVALGALRGRSRSSR